MFAALERIAAARVKARIETMVAAEPPPGVRVEGGEEQVVMSGRGLRRRLVTDPALRWWGK